MTCCVGQSLHLVATFLFFPRIKESLNREKQAMTRVRDLPSKGMEKLPAVELHMFPENPLDVESWVFRKTTRFFFVAFLRGSSCLGVLLDLACVCSCVFRWPKRIQKYHTFWIWQGQEQISGTFYCQCFFKTHPAISFLQTLCAQRNS